MLPPIGLFILADHMLDSSGLSRVAGDDEHVVALDDFDDNGLARDLAAYRSAGRFHSSVCSTRFSLALVAKVRGLTS